MGDVIRFGVIFSVILGMVIFSNAATAFSAPLCSELFRPVTKKVIQMDSASAEALRDFEQSRQEIIETRTVEEFHDALYLLATSANYVLASLVQNIFILNTQKLSPAAERLYVQSTNILFAKVETTFQIPLEALEKALEIRVQERILDEKAHYQASLVRAPLGFDIIQSRQDSRGQQIIEKMPLGFVKFRSESDPKKKTKKIPFGFIKFANTETDTPAEKIPMGFAITKPGETTDPSDMRAPLGFVHFGKTPLTEHAETKQIYLDLETGYFEVK